MTNASSATTTDGTLIATVRCGLTVRFADSSGAVSPHDFAPSDAAVILAMVPSINYACFRAVMFAAREIAKRDPVTRERIAAYFAA